MMCFVLFLFSFEENQHISFSLFILNLSFIIIIIDNHSSFHRPK